MSLHPLHTSPGLSRAEDFGLLTVLMGEADDDVLLVALASMRYVSSGAEFTIKTPVQAMEVT